MGSVRSDVVVARARAVLPAHQVRCERGDVGLTTERHRLLEIESKNLEHALHAGLPSLRPGPRTPVVRS